MVGTGGVYTVLVGDDLPKLGSDLVTALTSLDVYYLTHVCVHLVERVRWQKHKLPKKQFSNVSGSSANDTHLHTHIYILGITFLNLSRLLQSWGLDDQSAQTIQALDSHLAIGFL